MHLVGPYLTTTGKRKGKQKFRNAAEARKARELAQDWENLKSKWGVTSNKRGSKPTVVELPTASKPVIRDTGPKPQSLNSWHCGPVSSKANTQYTGTEVLGITIVHKSCLQPVFNQQQAEDAAKMRR